VPERYGGEVGDEIEDTGAQAMLSRLTLIEEQPLEERADAYQRIHRELAQVLEGHDTTRRDG
jgi:hypothetical protein